MRNEARFRVVEQRDAARFKTLVKSAQETSAERIAIYERLAHRAAEGVAPAPLLPTLGTPAAGR